MNEKLLIFSDLHGCLSSFERILEIYKEENCTKMIFLGDLLYHGPRNDIPEGYKPKEIANIIKDLDSPIIFIRGNCDARVDEMVTGRKMNDEYIEGNIMFCHGDLLLENELQDLQNIKLVFYGHTHVFQIHRFKHTTYVNLGSVSIPKDNEKSFVIYENNIIKRYNLNKKLLQEVEV